MGEMTNFTGKKLFFVRHAVALSTGAGGDVTRPLAPQGQEDAEALGQLMHQKGYQPDVVICSPALRTKQTYEAIQKHIEECKKVFYPDIMYNGDVGDYIFEIQNIDDQFENILVVAHNPSIYETVSLLAAQGSDSVMMRLSEGYSPATLSVIHCENDKWADLHPAENRLAELVSPLDYNAPSKPTRWM